jgi:hypothetical protein
MCIWIHIYSNLTFIPMLILPTAESRGVLLSFHLFTLSEKGTSMETNRIASRRALALIQIRAKARRCILIRTLCKFSLTARARIQALSGGPG